MHFATMSGTQVPLQEMKISVRFSTGRRVNLMYPFLFHLFAVTNLILHVCNTGSPRGDEDVGEVTFHDDPVFVRFDVTALPTPTEVTFTFRGFASKRHWQPPDGARRHQTGGCLRAAQDRSVQVHVLCHRVQRHHAESSGVLSGHGDQHAGQCTLPLAGQV